MGEETTFPYPWAYAPTQFPCPLPSTPILRPSSLLTPVHGKTQLLDHRQVPIDPVDPVNIEAWGQ